MLLTDIIPSDVSTMTGKYRTAVARGIPLLHSITLSMIDKEIIYSTWQSVSESGIYKVGILSYSKQTQCLLPRSYAIKILHKIYLNNLLNTVPMGHV